LEQQTRLHLVFNTSSNQMRVAIQKHTNSQTHIFTLNTTTPAYRSPEGGGDFPKQNSEITRQTQIFGCLGRQPETNLSAGLKVKGKGDREGEGKEGKTDTSAILKEEIYVRHTSNNKSIRTQ